MPDPITEPLAASNHNADLLTRAIGTTIGYHISKCRNGGYVVLVGGSIHSAHTTLVEAVRAMGSVAAAEYSESSEPPEHATDVTPPRGEADGARSLAQRLRPVPREASVPPDPAAAPARAAVSLVLAAFALVSSFWGL